jgi:hypothetical protein
MSRPSVGDGDRLVVSLMADLALGLARNLTGGGEEQDGGGGDLYRI